MSPIARYRDKGLYVVDIDRGPWSEIYVNAYIADTGKPTSAQMSVLNGLSGEKSVVNMRIFGGDAGVAGEIAEKISCENFAVERFEEQVAGMGPFIGLGAFIKNTIS